jgi:hypothetical protein
LFNQLLLFSSFILWLPSLQHFCQSVWRCTYLILGQRQNQSIQNPDVCLW